MDIIKPKFNPAEALAHRKATNARRLGELASIDIGI